MPRRGNALISGITGQDGSNLPELSAIGIVRVVVVIGALELLLKSYFRHKAKFAAGPVNVQLSAGLSGAVRL
jgi:hypothetical protein